MQKRLYRIICVCLMTGILGTTAAYPMAVRAEEAGTNQEVTTGPANGQNGSNMTGNSTVDKETGSGTTSGGSTGSTNTPQKSQAQKNVENAKNSIRDTFLSWISQIKKDENYVGAGNYTDSEHQYAVGIMKIPETEIQLVLDKLNVFKENLSKEDWMNGYYNVFDEIKNTELPNYKLPDTIGDWDTLSSEERQEIKKAISEKEGLPAQKGHKDFILCDYGYKGKPVCLEFNSNRNPNFKVQLHTEYKNHINSYKGPLGMIRPDIIWNGFQDFNSYIERIEALSRIAANSEAMEDFCVVGYLQDYHISEVRKDEVEIIDYTSDKRRWNIIDMATGESVDILYTNNPQHTLTTSFDRPGKYKIVAEQEAKYKKGTFVSYDICEYLFDVETQNLLYFNEKKVERENGEYKDGGGSMMLGAVEETGWVTTGDEFEYNINDLGQVEKDGSAVQRTE